MDLFQVETPEMHFAQHVIISFPLFIRKLQQKPCKYTHARLWKGGVGWWSNSALLTNPLNDVLKYKLLLSHIPTDTHTLPIIFRSSQT